MSNESSEVVISPSTSNVADRPIPIASDVHAVTENIAITTSLIVPKNGEEPHSHSNCSVGQQQQQQQQQQRESYNMSIPSPPIINNWHTMSTAATTITSNLQPRSSLNQPRMGPMDVPTHRSFPADIVVDDDIPKSRSVDAPPVGEIQIPSPYCRKRRADIDDDSNVEEYDNDADTTSSTQNLSRDGHQQYDAIDYKGMYFTSQRQNFALREQIQCVQEDNLRLKRQLIEMQRQLYTYSRNKRPSVSSLPYHSSSQHPNHVLGEVVPWSIPVNSTSRSHPECKRNTNNHHHYHRPRVLMVRYPQTSNSNISGNTNICPTTPPNATAYIDERAATTSTVGTTSPYYPGATAAPAITNGVSMSISSEEGNAVL